MADQKQMLELILDLRFGVANIIRSSAPITFPIQMKPKHSQASNNRIHAPQQLLNNTHNQSHHVP